MAEQLSEKQQRILDCALSLLRETGDAGMTLRKVADCAGMRLSNVQYYFKSRDEILTAMITSYLDACTDEIRGLMRDNAGSAQRERLHLLMLTVLRHGDELTDMCRIFRELWAISSRNAVVKSHLTAYYRTLSELVCAFAFGEADAHRAGDRLSSLLIPFFEGYSITADAVPQSTEQVAEMLTDLAMSIVAQAGDG